jgi:hypothetical protein
LLSVISVPLATGLYTISGTFNTKPQYTKLGDPHVEIYYRTDRSVCATLRLCGGLTSDHRWLGGPALCSGGYGIGVADAQVWLAPITQF